ncbi:MAG: DUF6517 family protein [Haloarculaceae archaeon]
MQRRTFITAAGTAGLIGVAGCSGVPKNLTFTAAPAVIDPAVASDTGYETKGPKSFELERSVELAGESRTLRVVTWTTAYTRQVASIIVLSTPNATALGQSLNPLAQLSGTELIARLLEELGGGSGLSITDLEPAGETPVTVFGQDATIEEFTAVAESPPGGAGPTAQFTGNTSSSQGIPIRLYLLSVPHEYSDGNDLIFTLAVQPQQKTTPETIYDLFGALQHPTKPPESANSSQ